jgi:hypothetical protein
MELQNLFDDLKIKVYKDKKVSSKSKSENK